MTSAEVVQLWANVVGTGTPVGVTGVEVANKQGTMTGGKGAAHNGYRRVVR
jgi:hypothetical protein